MKQINTILALVAAGLFLISALTYRDSVTRAERFERGQKFLPNLNPDEIAEILIVKGEENTQLKRSGEEFVLVGAHGYPAKNEPVNRFIKDVLGLALEKEVGSGESLEQELELTPEGENTTEVTFKDANGDEMVRFLVGKGFDDGSGNYVRRADEEENTIYLTGSRVYLNTGDDDFLKKDILDIKDAEVAAIQGDGFRLEEQDGSLKLLDVPAGQKESSKVSQVKNVLSYLRFDKHYLADAPEVQGLTFDRQLVVDLKDQSGYQLAVAQRDDKHYLRIQGFHRALPETIAIDADEEQVRETSEALSRGDEINEFNEFHGSWIYEVTETTADKVRMAASDLVEDA